MTNICPINDADTAKLNILFEKTWIRGVFGMGKQVSVAERHVNALNISKNTNAVKVYVSFD